MLLMVDGVGLLWAFSVLYDDVTGYRFLWGSARFWGLVVGCLSFLLGFFLEGSLRVVCSFGMDGFQNWGVVDSAIWIVQSWFFFNSDVWIEFEFFYIKFSIYPNDFVFTVQSSINYEILIWKFFFVKYEFTLNIFLKYQNIMISYINYLISLYQLF